MTTYYATADLFRAPSAKEAAEIGRTPQGVRGLKLAGLAGRLAALPVAPRKGCVD